jgi:hypothetical protein
MRTVDRRDKQVVSVTVELTVAGWITLLCDNHVWIRKYMVIKKSCNPFLGLFTNL